MEGIKRDMYDLIGSMGEVQGCCEGGRAGRIKARPGGGGAQNAI
jgi:hypothetical protein